MRAQFWNPLLGAVVDQHEAETLAVSLCPFEVVEERPRVVPAQIDARSLGRPRPREIAVEVGDPFAVDDVAVGVDRVVEVAPFSVT